MTWRHRKQTGGLHLSGRKGVYKQAKKGRMRSGAASDGYPGASISAPQPYGFGLSFNLDKGTVTS